MAPKVHPVPPEVDRAVALAALGPLGVGVDEPTDAQRRYAQRWEGGTW